MKAVRDEAAREEDARQAKAELIGFCLKSGGLVAGVADAGAFEDVPEGYRPADLLPNAKSVVVVGGAPLRLGDWASTIPEHLETMGTGDRINSLGMKVAKAIEERFGHYALFVPPGLNKGNRPFLSVALAAERAGCGSRSLAGPILNREHGFLYYTAIVTTLALPADTAADNSADAAEEPPACPAPQCVAQWEAEGTTPCLAVCPIGDDGCLGGRLENGRIAARRYDAAKCTSRVHTYWVPGFQKSLEAALNQDDPERRKMILYGSFFTRTLWSITYAAQSQGQCMECMRVCPAANPLLAEG